MRYASAIVTALTLLVGATASAQRQFRVGPTVSSISITLGGATHSYASYGGSMALITGDDGEIGLSLQDRKSTRLNSSHPSISYAVFCLKKKKTHEHLMTLQNSTAT